MKRVLVALTAFAAYLTVVGIAASASRGSFYYQIADLTLLSLHLAFIALMSVLVLQDKWRDRRHPGSRPTMLRRIRGWITDDRTF